MVRRLDDNDEPFFDARLCTAVRKARNFLCAAAVGDVGQCRFCTLFIPLYVYRSTFCRERQPRENVDSRFRGSWRCVLTTTDDGPRFKLEGSNRFVAGLVIALPLAPGDDKGVRPLVDELACFETPPDLTRVTESEIVSLLGSLASPSATAGRSAWTVYGQRATMGHSLPDILAIAALVLWPAIPLFWIPVHCAPTFFRRLGLLTYLLPFVTWLPVAVVAFILRDDLLRYRMDLPLPVKAAGLILFVAGAGLQTWTLLLLTLPVITGMPEVTRSRTSRLVTTGPFGVVRHPTYLSHTMMIVGIFLLTGATTLGVVTLVDVFVVNALVIPLEEKELLQRFAREYEEYRRKVPSRFLPLRRKRRKQ